MKTSPRPTRGTIVGLSSTAILSGFLAVSIRTAAPSQAGAPFKMEEIDLSRFFHGMEGTFVVSDLAGDRLQVYNSKRALQRFIPASTFKIPNTLISLETGVADGLDFAIPWDSAETPPESWWPRNWTRDQTLETAFKNSVFWYYQELARRVGVERMKDFLARFNYGNQDLTGGIDQFWLRGGIRISAIEQVDFIRRMLSGQLGVSDRSTALVKNLMLLEEDPQYRLSGKTGTAELTETRELGWLVGFAEIQDQLWIYALNMEGEQVWEEWPPGKRKDLVLTLLRSLGAVP